MNLKEPAVKIEWKFDAPILSIWDAWTTEAMISKWFGSDPGGKVLSAKLHPIEGGDFNVTFVDSDLTTHTCYGTYLEVSKPRRLMFDWTWKNEPGVLSLVTVELKEESSFTVMNFIHSGVGTASQHNYTIGWTNTFKKLELLLAQNGPEKREL